MGSVGALHRDDDLYCVERRAGGRSAAVFALAGVARPGTPEQRARCSLEPRGFAMYWEELDNGIEVAPLLTPQPV